MQKTYKGVSKILLLVIIGSIIISAIMFGYGGDEVQNARDHVQDKAQGVIGEKSDEVVTKMVEGGQEAIGKKLKEVGEKMLNESDDPGFYGIYDEENEVKYAKTILFFTAQWCPSCVEAEDNIEADKDKIPTDVAILTVNFDDSKQLREKYNVNKQHTFVLIGIGELDDKSWSGSKTLSEIIDNIK